MSEELDPNKLVVEFINANLDKIAQPIISGIKGTKAIIRSKLETTYSAYLLMLRSIKKLVISKSLRMEDSLFLRHSGLEQWVAG